MAMQLHIDEKELTKAVDEVMRARGYEPRENLQGRTISLSEFAKKYGGGHGEQWMLENVIYKFKPSWCPNIAPGRGRKFVIFEYSAGRWLERHKDQINW